jgi:hypothetical protein
MRGRLLLVTLTIAWDELGIALLTLAILLVRFAHFNAHNLRLLPNRLMPDLIDVLVHGLGDERKLDCIVHHSSRFPTCRFRVGIAMGLPGRIPAQTLGRLLIANVTEALVTKLGIVFKRADFDIFSE